MSVTTIDLKMNTACEKSEQLFKKKYDWQEEVDSLLDRMNELNGLLMSYHTLILNITGEIERDNKAFKKSELAPEAIKKLTTITSKVLLKVRKSNLYPGVKSTYKLLKLENNYLRELFHDRNVGLELEEDKEMQKIMKDSIDAANDL